MSALRELRARHGAVESMRKLMAAMRVVSATKVRHAHRAFQAACAAHGRLLAVRAQALNQADDLSLSHPYNLDGSASPVWLVIGSDRGLCGAFNAQLARLVQQRFNAAPVKPRILIAGQRSGTALKALEQSIVACLPLGKGQFQNARELDERLATLSNSNFEHCHVLFMRYKNTLSQEPACVSLCELMTQRVQTSVSQPTATQPPAWPAVEPTPEIFLERLQRFLTKTALHMAMTESILSEQTMRMVAMEGAVRNSDELLEELDLLYNRKRQALVTEELIEVISGVNAL